MDLNGNGKADRIVKQFRPARDPEIRESRIALFLDSPTGGKPAWSSAWNDEMEMETSVQRPRRLDPLTSLVELDASGGDYDEGRFIVVHQKLVRDEILFGVDYGQGMLKIDTTSGAFAIVASDDHLSLRGRPLSSRARCPATQAKAVRLVFDRRRHQFFEDKSVCLTSD